MNKKLILSLVIFALLSFAITGVMIVNKNNFESRYFTYYDSDVFSTNVKKVNKGIKLTDTYDENSLVVNEIKYEYGDTSFDIPQISGLKNKDVENFINNDIWTKVEDELKNGPIEGVYTYTYGNFANILSLEMSFYSSEWLETKQYFLNYDLNNGKYIRFEDVFVDDVDLTNIVTKIFYRSLTVEDFYNAENEYYANYEYVDGEEWVPMEYIAGPNEDELYKQVQTFINSKNKNFVISVDGIRVETQNGYGNLQFETIPDDVAIYTRFLTNKNIYEDQSVGYKDLFVCSKIYANKDEQINYGLIEENLWCDFLYSNYYNIEDMPSEYAEAFRNFDAKRLDELKQYVEEWREKALNNPSKFYIIGIRGGSNPASYSTYDDYDYSWISNYSKLGSTTVSYSVLEMSKDFYEESMEEVLAKLYRKYGIFDYEMNLEENFGISSDDCKYTYEQVENVYNYLTDEKLDDVSEIFHDGVDYEQIIRETTRNKLIRYRDEEWYEYKDLTDEEIESQVDNLAYQLTSYGIKVILPDLESFFEYVYYDDILEYINIFE